MKKIIINKLFVDFSKVLLVIIERTSKTSFNKKKPREAYFENQVLVNCPTF